MTEDEPAPPPDQGPPPAGMQIEVLHALDDAVEGPRRARHLWAALQAQTLLVPRDIAA